MRLTALADLLFVAFLVSTTTACQCANTDVFQLKAVSNDTRFNGLILSAYHTGPTQNDLTLSTTTTTTSTPASVPATFTFNGTYLASPLFGRDPSTNCPYFSVQLLDPSFYGSSWATPTLYVGGETEGFYYDNVTGLGNGYEEGARWKGWMACFWSHQGEAQLFNLGVPPGEVYKPSNCGFVNLMKV